MGGNYNYAAEMGSCAMTHIPSFINIGSAIQKSIGGKHRYTDNMVALYVTEIIMNRGLTPELKDCDGTKF
jgi:hypothetical protein